MRVYSVPFALTAVDAAADILEIRAGEGQRCVLLGFHVGKCGSTSERVRLTVKRFPADATSGSVPSTGGGSVTPAKMDGGDAAFAGTAEAGNETRASGGTGGAVTLVEDALDPSAGYDFVPPDPEERPAWGDQEYLVIGIESAPTNVAWNGYAVVAEL